MEFDSSWCPVCDRQIQPKRTLVPIVPHDPRALSARSRAASSRAPAVSSPTAPSSAPTHKSPPRHISPAGAEACPAVKYRTVIDQGPIPLYCSDECRLADTVQRERDGSLSHRGQPLDAESASNSSSSIQSQSSLSPHLALAAKLAAYYNFELPTTAPVCDDSSSSEPEYYPLEYNSGIMMAGKLIESMCPKPSKPSPSYRGVRQPPKELKPVPGWTDGSNAWRSTVYGFSSPKTTPESLEESSKAYRGFVASPHRSSHGVYSTVGDSKAPTPTSTRSALSTGSLPSTTNDMLSKFSQSLNRRSESRATLYPRRERSIVKPGAEGKLLVPDVKLKVGSGSSASLSSTWSTASSRRSVRSPLSAGSCDGESSDEDASTQRCDSAASLPHVHRRPVVETRSWSYDNLKTYPIMQLPPKKEKRLEKHIVDGKEVEVEVEVIVEQRRKRLFLFPPSARA
ncbi:hypothetical protein BDQ17DRAFT_1387048 [Cyathus striatus]|nr:hypothetical protein BDQ17DRAFT_1387048 [Cyathus striatus]